MQRSYGYVESNLPSLLALDYPEENKSVPVPEHYIGTFSHLKYCGELEKVTNRLSFLEQRVLQSKADEYEQMEMRFLHENRNHIIFHMKEGLPYKEFVHKNTDYENLLMMKKLILERLVN